MSEKDLITIVEEIVGDLKTLTDRIEKHRGQINVALNICNENFTLLGKKISGIENTIKTSNKIKENDLITNKWERIVMIEAQIMEAKQVRDHGGNQEWDDFKEKYGGKNPIVLVRELESLLEKVKREEK